MSVFKVWDYKSKQWLDEICDVYLLPSGEVIAGDINNPPCITVPKESVFMGSKQTDSKGNVIYDGSIVRMWSNDSYIPNRDSGGGIIDYDLEEGHSQVGLIVYENGSFNYYTKRQQVFEGKTLVYKEDIDDKWNIKSIPIDFVGFFDGFEVVGHIAKNPDFFE